MIPGIALIQMGETIMSILLQWVHAMGTYNKLFSLIFFSSMKGLGQVRSHIP